jgi:hypothetical protein
MEHHLLFTFNFQTLHIVNKKNACTSPRHSASTCVSGTSVIPHPKLPEKKNHIRRKVAVYHGLDPHSLVFCRLMRISYRENYLFELKHLKGVGHLLLIPDLQSSRWRTTVRSQTLSHIYTGSRSQSEWDGNRFSSHPTTTTLSPQWTHSQNETSYGFQIQSLNDPSQCCSKCWLKQQRSCTRCISAYGFLHWESLAKKIEKISWTKHCAVLTVGFD